MAEEWEYTSKIIFQSRNLSKEEVNDLIAYKKSNTIPSRLKGIENKNKRDLFRKTSKKFEISTYVTSNCMKTVLLYISKEKKILLSKEEILQKIILMHGQNHIGRDALYYNLNIYKIYDNKKIIKAFLSNCKICMKKKKSRNLPPLKPIQSSRKRERIVIDYFEMPVDITGNRYGLIMIDSFTKFVWSRPYPTKESLNVCEFIRSIFKVYF